MTQPALVLLAIHLESLYVDPVLQGKTLHLGERDGIRYELGFPSDVHDPWEGPDTRFDAPAEIVERSEAHEPRVMEVRRLVLRAHLTTELDSLATHTDWENCTSEQFEEAQRLRHVAAATGEPLFRRFMELLALRSLNFGTVVSLPPNPDTTTLLVGDPQNVVRVGLGVGMVMHYGRQILDAAATLAIATEVAIGSAAPLHWRLYGDAYQELYIENDERYCLLLAAAAMEIGVRVAMFRKRPEDPLLEMALDRRPIKYVLKRVAEVVLGTSYAVQDKVGYDRLHRLQEQRNSLIHRGAEHPVAVVKGVEQRVSRSDLEMELAAVLNLLRWLDSVAS